MVLRQRHTEGAILYEKKLKPFLKNLNEGKGNRSNSPCLICFLLPPFVWAQHHCLRALTLSQLVPDTLWLLSHPSTQQSPSGLVCPFLPKEAFHN